MMERRESPLDWAFGPVVGSGQQRYTLLYWTTWSRGWWYRDSTTHNKQTTAWNMRYPVHQFGFCFDEAS